MAAAERIFDGSFDHVRDDDGDVEMVASNEASSSSQKGRLIVSDVSVFNVLATDCRNLDTRC